MNPQFKETEVEYEVNDSGAEIIILDANLYPTVEKIKENTNLREFLIIESQENAIIPEGTISWSNVIKLQRNADVRFFRPSCDGRAPLSSHLSPSAA